MEGLTGSQNPGQPKTLKHHVEHPGNAKRCSDVPLVITSRHMQNAVHTYWCWRDLATVLALCSLSYKGLESVPLGLLTEAVTWKRSLLLGPASQRVWRDNWRRLENGRGAGFSTARWAINVAEYAVYTISDTTNPTQKMMRAAVLDGVGS